MIPAVLAFFLAILPISSLGAEPGENSYLPAPSGPNGENPNAPARRLTIEDCMALAVQVASSVSRAKNDHELTGHQLAQSYAQFMPTLQATMSLSDTQGKALNTNSNPTSVEFHNHGGTYQLASSLSLFNGFADSNSLKSALSRRRASELTLERVRQQIRLDIAQTFMQIVLDRQIVTIAESNLAGSRAREQLLVEQNKVGLKNIGDLYRQQAQLSSDETLLMNAKTKERNDELLLLRKLRLPTDGRYEFVKAPVGESEKSDANFDDEAKLIELAISRRPDLKASQITVAALVTDIRVARAGLYPRLDLGLSMVGTSRVLDKHIVNGNDASGTQYQSFQDQAGNNIVYTLGVTMTWAIFDRMLTKTSIERASIAARNATNDSVDVKNQVVGEVRQVFGEYRAAKQLMESASRGQRAAQKAYEVIEARYKVGASSFVDLLSAQAVLVQAKAAWAQAQIALALQSRVVQTVVGNP